MPELLGDLEKKEQSTGQWFYHLVRNGYGLCGVGPTHLFAKSLPASDWMFRGDGHVPYRYCKECDRLARLEVERVRAGQQ